MRIIMKIILKMKIILRIIIHNAAAVLVFILAMKHYHWNMKNQ
jgi:hypothetical protein